MLLMIILITMLYISLRLIYTTTDIKNKVGTAESCWGKEQFQFLSEE